MQPLVSDLSAGLLSEEQDSQLLLLQLPCKEKEEWTMEKRKGRSQTVLIQKMINSGRFLKLSFSP